jgi:hypothetical protein
VVESNCQTPLHVPNLALHGCSWVGLPRSQRILTLSICGCKHPSEHAGTCPDSTPGRSQRWCAELQSNGTRGDCVRLSTAESDDQRSGGHFQLTRHLHRVVRRGLFRLLFLFNTITCCKRPREHSGSCIESTPGAVATPVLALAVGSQQSQRAKVRLSG